MRRLTGKLWFYLVLIFLYAPIVVLIVFSFNSTNTMGHWTGFSLKWYEQLFNDYNIRSALITTIEVALIASVLATVIGTMAAIALHGSGAFVRKTLYSISYLPMLNPDIVTGVSLMLFFGSVGMSLGFTTMMLSQLSFCVPYVILSVMPKLTALNKSTYEAALDLGASRFKAYTKVVLPEIAPGIVTGFMISLMLSLDDFMISYFNTGSGVKNLSILIYGSTRTGVKPVYNAVSAIMFSVVLVLLVIINIRQYKSEKKKNSEGRLL